MISLFENYLKLGKVKRKTPDYEEAKALLEQSKERMEYTKLKDINQKIFFTTNVFKIVSNNYKHIFRNYIPIM